MYNKFIFDYSKEDVKGYSLPKNELSIPLAIDQSLLRCSSLDLPQVSEGEVVRHYTRVSQKNYGVETGFYPLGSCTMKYNPKVNELISAGFANLHPLQDEDTVQGSLKAGFELSKLLCEITGMADFSLNPYAGAHGELAGLMIIKHYHQTRHDTKRNKIIIPDSAHGTNPASATLVGFDTIELPSLSDGTIDVETLKTVMNEEVAGIMLTNPNTLGIFETRIKEVADIVHQGGGLLYYDGANLNALLGNIRPGDMGFDIIHLNLHKTFSTPHGGGGPGSGPLGVASNLLDFLPKPHIVQENGVYKLSTPSNSIGSISSFLGNVGVWLKALAYILSLGKEHLKVVSQLALLSANYLRVQLQDDYNLFIDSPCMHEVVFNGLKNNPHQVKTLDVAKRILDYGYHAPTIYFPLLAPQAMMIEPTETESKQTLDDFIKVLKTIAKEALETPELVFNAPTNTIISRLDEVKAVRQPILTYKDLKS